MSEASRAAALSFQLSDDGTKVLALFDPAGERRALDVPAIKEALAAPAFADLFIHEDALRRLSEQCLSATERFVLEVGERRDGRCTAKVSHDAMTAWLTITRPWGGKPVDRADVDRALREQRVIAGFLEEEIAAAIAEGEVEDRVVARGRPAVPGTDAQFQSLVPEIQSRRPKVDEHEIADYRELGGILLVRQGDSLMVRVPATPGENGVDVHGRAILAQPGKDLPFAPMLKGTSLDPADRNRLVSAIAGQPVLVPNGVMVEPTISLPQVDISTGNVTFEGTVMIKGDLKAGMKVRTSADVAVDGTVESAEIEAGGNVTVKGGVVGGSGTGTARINCKGTFHARFVENAHVVAGVDILIDELALNSELIALNQITVGKPGSGKGHIRGGQACATTLVQAAVIGSPAGIKTRAQVGFNPHVQEQLAALEQEIEKNGKEQADLEKVVALCRNDPGKRGLLEKAQHTIDKLRSDVALFQEDRNNLQTAMKLAENARVVVEKKVHAGSEIQVGTRHWTAEDDRAHAVFRLNKEGEIQLD